MRSLALLPIALLGACASSSSPLCPALPPGAVADDFEYAAVERVVMAPPEPMELPLDLDVEAAPPGFQSRRAFEAAVSLGDPWAWGRIADVVRRVDAATDLDEETPGTVLWRLLPRWKDDDSCTRVAALTARAHGLATRRPLLKWMASCGTSDEVDALYTAPDVPAALRLERLLRRDVHDGRKAQLSEHELRWLRSVATELRRREAMTTIGVVLAQDGRLSVLEQLLELAAAADPERRKWLFSAVDLAPRLCRSAEARVRVKAFATEYALDLERFERQCEEPSPEEVVSRFTSGRMPIADFRAYPRRAEVVTLLTRCAGEAARVHPDVPCADALTWLDRDAGLRLAREELARAVVPANPPLRFPDQRRHALRRLFTYRDAETLDRALREVGLIAPEDTADLAWLRAVPDRVPPATAGVAPVPLLRAVRRLEVLPAWTRKREPPPHDVLVRVLASLAGPALADVAFEQAPDERREGGSLVHAYVGGERLTAAVESRRTFQTPSGPIVVTGYDIPAVVGLLNTLLRERGDPRRFARLGETQRPTTLLGRPRSIARAAACGLILRADGPVSVSAP